MTSNIRTIALAALVAVASLSATLHAQTLPTAVRVNVPFSFDYGSKHFGRGVYNLTMDGEHILIVRSSTSVAAAMVQSSWIGRRRETASSSSKSTATATSSTRSASQAPTRTSTCCSRATKNVPPVNSPRAVKTLPRSHSRFSLSASPATDRNRRTSTIAAVRGSGAHTARYPLFARYRYGSSTVERVDLFAADIPHAQIGFSIPRPRHNSTFPGTMRTTGCRPWNQAPRAT